MFQRHTCVSREGSAREQGDPEVREGVGKANQSGPIGFSHTSTTSSETSSPWKSRLSSPQITVRNNSPVILRPLQFPASFFVVHGISSPSSTSHCRSCSSREFIFRPFFSTTKVCPDLLNLSNAGNSFAGISSLTLVICFPESGT
jgi:hypothetical protein